MDCESDINNYGNLTHCGAKMDNRHQSSTILTDSDVGILIEVFPNIFDSPAPIIQ